MKLQYCEDGIHPKVIIGIIDIIIEDRVLNISHSGGYVDCKVSVSDSSLLYLEADEKIRIHYSSEDGKIRLMEIIDDYVVIKFKEGNIVVGEVNMEKIRSLYVEEVSH